MKELGEALKAIFGKISGFFDIFDLSFFVSGAVSLSALLFWVYLAGKEIPYYLQGWLRVLALILACYVNGLICFAGGRWICMGRRRRNAIQDFDIRFNNVLQAHGLNDKEPFKEYLARNSNTVRGSWRLYVRLWAEVRKFDQLSPSLSFLNRYWVMAATYDGVGMAVIVWAFMFGVWCLGWGLDSKIQPVAGVPIILIII